MIPWAHPSPQPKRHLDRLSRFSGLTSVTDRPIDRQTGHATRSVTIGRIYVYGELLCGLKTVVVRPPPRVNLSGTPTGFRPTATGISHGGRTNPHREFGTSLSQLTAVPKVPVA